MSIELATTQPVRQPGMPGPPGAPQADQLGMTLRERMWLARAALGTIVLSLATSLVLLSKLPSEETARAASPMQAELAERALRPAPLAPAPVVIAPLPVGEVQRAPAPVSEPEPVAVEPEPAPLTSHEPAVAVSRPSRRVTISRGRLAPQHLVAAPAVDLSKPQSLAPVKREWPVEEAPPVEPPPPPLAKPVPEPELKRPSFE